jgi:uncharacterized membrane protein
MRWEAIVILIVFGAGIVVNVARIGRPVVPLTPKLVARALVLQAFLIALIVRLG